MVYAYSQLKRILRTQQLTVPQLKKRIEERGHRINIKTLYRLSQETEPVERLDLRLAGLICQVCEIALSDLIAFRKPQQKFQRLSATKQKRLDFLMGKCNEGTLTAVERKEFQTMANEVEEMTLANAQFLANTSRKLASQR